MNPGKALMIVGAFIALLLLKATFYSLDETEQAIILQFGKPVGTTIEDAGLHFKLPYPIQEVLKFEKRFLEWDGDAKQIPTSEKTYIWVDTFARWRISDPLKFYQRVTNEASAQSRLDDIINSATRNYVSENLLIEIVRNSNRELQSSLDIGGDISGTKVDQIEKGREMISRAILAKAQEAMPDFGIELLDVRIKRINYSEQVRQKVYERMISERHRIAEKYRSEGQGLRAEVDGKRQKELQRITSEGYRKAQEIKGRADAEAIKIYANSYGRDPEFYSFIKTLESYQKTLKDNTTLIINTDSEFLRYLKKIR